ncbi:MAG: hypothetical protein ACLR5X_11495 [Oscillospiraceae bacterium]
MKKLVSLLLAVCLMASLAIGASAAEPTTVDVSGGTGTSSVSLSSTSDGTLDGDPAATKMNVVIPTILPIAVGTDGTVTTATDIRITNNSFGAVKVDNVKVEAGTGWKLTAFGSKRQPCQGQGGQQHDRLQARAGRRRGAAHRCGECSFPDSHRQCHRRLLYVR